MIYVGTQGYEDMKKALESSGIKVETAPIPTMEEIDELRKELFKTGSGKSLWEQLGERENKAPGL